MRFEKSLYAGTSPDKAEEAFQLIGHELEIGRAGERNELCKKGEDIVGPDAAMNATTALEQKASRLWSQAERSS